MLTNIIFIKYIVLLALDFKSVRELRTVVQLEFAMRALTCVVSNQLLERGEIIFLMVNQTLRFIKTIEY